jgi:hypothetical protein
MTRQYIIAAIVGLILVTSLGIGGPAIALVITLTGASVILMMVRAGWPWHSAEYRSQLKPDTSATRSTRSLQHQKSPGPV